MDYFRTSPLFRFIYSDRHLLRVRQLLTEGEDPNCQVYGGLTPLIEAVTSEDDTIGVVRELIKSGADVNMRTHLGLTALHFAVVRRKRSVVDALIQSGVLVNAKTYCGYTALHFAVTKLVIRIPPFDYNVPPDTWIIDKLLKLEDIDYDSQDSYGQTPLMLAVRDQQVDAVWMLLNKNANPNICNKISNTPLHVAFSMPTDCNEIQLLKSGASIYYVNKTDQTPMDILLKKEDRSFNQITSLLRFIVLKYNITNDLKRKLDCIHELSEYFSKCCGEVFQMRSDFVSGNITVHDIILDCFNDNQFQNIPLEIHKPLVDRLVRDTYPVYFGVILENIPDSSLLAILKMTAGSRACVNSGRVIDLAYLLSKMDITILIGEYLYFVEIFYLIVAFSNVRISKMGKNMHFEYSERFM